MPRIPHTSPQTLQLFDALLADPGAWRHGYALTKEIGLASGTLYPILIRLAEQGLLETRWEEQTVPGRPARHAYRLTSDGAALASDRLAARRSRLSHQPSSGPVLGGSGPALGGAS